MVSGNYNNGDIFSKYFCIPIEIASDLLKFKELSLFLQEKYQEEIGIQSRRSFQKSYWCKPDLPGKRI